MQHIPKCTSPNMFFLQNFSNKTHYITHLQPFIPIIPNNLLQTLNNIFPTWSSQKLGFHFLSPKSISPQFLILKHFKLKIMMPIQTSFKILRVFHHIHHLLLFYSWFSFNFINLKLCHTMEIMRTPWTSSTKVLAIGILPNSHHKPYLPIQKQ